MGRPSDRIIAAAIIGWTLIAWGGRVALLTGGEDLWGLLRILGSLLVAAFVALTLLVSGLRSGRRVALWSFAIWTVVVWARSLIVNWVESGTLAFKLVHTALGVGFLALVVWALLAATRGRPVSEPDEGHGDKQ